MFANVQISNHVNLQIPNTNLSITKFEICTFEIYTFKIYTLFFQGHNRIWLLLRFCFKLPCS
ncbi:hypothetical protein BH11BAC7_BH11BAC7_25860 [soil metagenome]